MEIRRQFGKVFIFEATLSLFLPTILHMDIFTVSVSNDVGAVLSSSHLVLVMEKSF